MARWQHNTTGYIHPKSSVKAADRTPEFLAQHSWNIPRESIEQIARTALGKKVFICGTFDNEADVLDLFDRAFALYVDDETLTYRLATREGNNWGKQPHELRQTLNHHHSIYDTYRKLGFAIVDSTQPIDLIVGQVTADIE